MLWLTCVVEGMSTCPEVIVARHGQRPIRCVGLSLISNQCVMDYGSQLTANHDECLDAADQRIGDLQRFLFGLIDNISVDGWYRDVVWRLFASGIAEFTVIKI